MKGTILEALGIDAAIRTYKWVCNDESCVNTTLTDYNVLPKNICDEDTIRMTICRILPLPDFIESERDVRMFIAHFIVAEELFTDFHPDKSFSLYMTSTDVPMYSKSKIRHYNNFIVIIKELHRMGKSKTIYELVDGLLNELVLPY